MSAFVEKDGRHGRSYKMTPERLSRIQKLLNKGESNNSIACQEGISEGSIRYMIKQGQLKKRKESKVKGRNVRPH
jgi:DNA-binding NarL/FixJ family response regulator